MSAIMIFQKDTELLSISEISHSLAEFLGLGCAVVVEDRRVAVGEYEGSTGEFHDGRIYVELPELQEEEGEPTVDYHAAPRLDRDETWQRIADEIIEQEPALRPEIEENARDILLTFDDTVAAIEAATAIAYIVAGETNSGLLVRSSEEDEDSVWFPNAEAFADFVYGEEDAEPEFDEDEEEDEK